MTTETIQQRIGGYTPRITEETLGWTEEDTIAYRRGVWADVLRSGKFKQTGGYLALQSVITRERAYCVWGVACEIAVDEGVIPPARWEDREGIVCGAYGIDSADEEETFMIGAPPMAVVEYFGMRGQMSNLMTANDEGMPFETLAERIERGYV